jgi:MbtH protein
MAETETKETLEALEEKFYVVKNIEEQYSIWPSYKQIPNGWEIVGEPRIKSDCLAYIEQVWTDMRPLSLRRQMETVSRDEKITDN